MSDKLSNVTALLAQIGEHHASPKFKRTMAENRDKEIKRLVGDNFPVPMNTHNTANKLGSIRLKRFKATNEFIPPFI